MNNKIPRKVIDVTGVELTPGDPKGCLGNGEQGFECCCDESDYFLLCFPEFYLEVKEILENKAYMIKKTRNFNNPRPFPVGR